MKNWLKKPKKEKFPTPPVPRQRAEIVKEFEQLAAQAGSTQYLITVKERELQQVNQRLFELNNEASAREQLDKQVAATKPEVPSV